MRITRSALLTSIAVAAMIPTTAFAQEAEDGAEGEEIIVTARRLTHSQKQVQIMRRVLRS